MRIGVFGGSFDPVHLGHLWIAEAATESLRLDRLLWVPAATQPLKPGGPVADEVQRLEMLRLAIAGREGHVVDDREIRRQGVSYTVETIGEIKSEYGGAELFLILGGDSLHSLDQWKSPERLLQRVTPAAVRRGGDKELDFSIVEKLAGDEAVRRARASVIEMPLIEISSSEIRDRVGQDRGIRHRVPRAVEAYIVANGVYSGPAIP